MEPERLSRVLSAMLNVDRAKRRRSTLEICTHLIMKRAQRIIIYVVLGSAACAILAVAVNAVRSKRIDRGYARIHVGDSKDQEIAALGSPSEVEVVIPGTSRPSPPEFAEVLVYNSLTHRWIIVIDTDGKVGLKYHKFAF